MTSRFPLGKFNILEGRLSKWDHLEPLNRNVKWWRRSRDGCAGQYQGKGAFRRWQMMKACHGLQSKDKQKPANHDKDRANGGAQTLGGMVKRSYTDDCGKGT